MKLTVSDRELEEANDFVEKELTNGSKEIMYMNFEALYNRYQTGRLNPQEIEIMKRFVPVILKRV